MSSPRSDNGANSAWLRESGGARYLDVRGWAPEPTPGHLSVFAPDFALNTVTPWLVGREVDQLNLTPEPWPRLVSKVDPSATAFAQTHEDVMSRIAAGEFDKVVPIVTEDLRFAEDLSPGMFNAASATVPGQYAYGFAFAGEGLCGVTPELLFEVDGDRLRTMALAGTALSGSASLLDDPKERLEHQLVIDHVAAEVKRWGRVEVGDTVEREYGRLKHLFTPIEVRLRARPRFMDLVVRLHPTAALGGYPRRPAAEWLMRQEFHVARGRFGAPFGTYDGDTARCVVAIRGAEWRGGALKLSAGCGVVAGSRADNEWAELALKRGATYRNLGLEP